MGPIATMLLPTLDDVARSGLLEEIETLHLDRGYDYPRVRPNWLIGGPRPQYSAAGQAGRLGPGHKTPPGTRIDRADTDTLSSAS
jgi:hypothetical protein